MGCVREYATDDQCDPACNNVMCGFDDGRCEGVRPHVVGSDAVCYSGETPSAAVVVAGEEAVCGAYAARSCCARPAEAAYMDALVGNATSSAQCRVQAECASLLAQLLCATCAPQSNTYFRTGKLRVCRREGEHIFDVCASSQFVNPATGACATVDSLYRTASAFISVYGDLALDACYGENGGAGLGTGAVVAIVVVCLLVVVAAAAVGVFFVLRHKNKDKNGGKDGAVAMGEIPDASSNMTLVPVDMMSANPDGGVIFLDGTQALASVSAAPAVAAPATAVPPGSGPAGATSSGNVSSGGVVSGVPAGAGATMMVSQNMPMMMMTAAPGTMDGMGMNTMVVPMGMTATMGAPMQAVPPMPMMAMPMMDMNGMVVMNTTTNMSQIAQQVQPPADPSSQTPSSQQ